MSKGSRREREAVDILKKAGYAVYRPATVRFGENDMFGLFDVMAVAPDLPMRAIQVKSNRATGIRAWAKHTQLFRENGFVTEYWCPYDRKGWRLIRCYENESEDFYDGRTSDEKIGKENPELIEALRSESV